MVVGGTEEAEGCEEVEGCEGVEGCVDCGEVDVVVVVEGTGELDGIGEVEGCGDGAVEVAEDNTARAGVKDSDTASEVGAVTGWVEEVGRGWVESEAKDGKIPEMELAMEGATGSDETLPVSEPMVTRSSEPAVTWGTVNSLSFSIDSTRSEVADSLPAFSFAPHSTPAETAPPCLGAVIPKAARTELGRGVPATTGGSPQLRTAVSTD